jgi:RHH-type proline utilization regulon transcriptional repressor/proline dehydrogenase/delta 1-pyrroline-5-carboxylate dehydrogenase
MVMAAEHLRMIDQEAAMTSEPMPPLESSELFAQRAVALAETLLRSAKTQQTAQEYHQAQRIARMMGDPHGKELTIALADQAFRSHQPARIADQLHYLLEKYGAPRFMDWWERAALTLGGLLGHYVPSLVVPPVVARLRQETRTLILPGEEEELRDYLQARRASGTRLNLNQLGEAILGEDEAQRRLAAYLALLAREDVEYISVKISSIFSQINLVAFRHTVELIKERLRILYRQAMTHHFRQPDGRLTSKFINLDMEEYRDLELTVAAFCEVLDEPEFLSLRAGIVLQAYLPDSFGVQQRLTAWALARCARGGAPIKVRIVKGANLAMEQVEAALHGWPQAPYTSKREVDANYKRMVEYGCRAEYAQAVHLGIASHNLFDLAYGLLLREQRQLHDQIEFEMLEGMANHQARAVQSYAGGLLLYAPVVKAEDFHSAIAYLVRRLDENTAPENFLHDLFALEPGSPAWEQQRDRFLAAFTLIDSVSEQPRRTQDRRREQPILHLDQPFANEPDTDWSLAANRDWIDEVIQRWRMRTPEYIPLQIGGELITTSDPQIAQIPQTENGLESAQSGSSVSRLFVAEGHDPSRPGQTAYHYVLADHAMVDQALAAAVQAQTEWAARPATERRHLLLQVADELARRRGDLIGAMLLDGAKTATEADPEVSEAVDFARYYAHAFDLGDGVADCRLTPLGVVVVTPPWNFPLSIPAGGVLAALMAGNSVILKPAPEAVLVGWHLAQALWAAGMPKTVLQFLPCPDNEVGQALVTDTRVAAVILTGSAQTARLFLDWRPDLRLFAETSGKNSLIITALADRDQAIKDLVRSAFGHNGQKCSAASLAICEAEVYDDPAFRRQLADATASLTVGSAWETPSRITPLTQPPGAALRRALTTLDEGEEWLLEPKQVGDNPLLWSPGIKLGVQPGSFFHQTECFGPVLGLMRAENLGQAIELANGVAFGLTGGIHSLDDCEINQWMEAIEVGNGYINRHITGAIVKRQPFGGWKQSVFGPGAKAGGPNYVLQLTHWQQVDLPTEQAEPSPSLTSLLERCLHHLAGPQLQEVLRASAGSYAWAWQTHFSREHDPSQVLGERNIFRYRPCRQVLVRCEPTAPAGQLALCQMVLAARTCCVPVTVSLPLTAPEWAWLAGEDGVRLVYEAEHQLTARLADSTEYERMRAPTPISLDLQRAANHAHVAVIAAPALANGWLELRWYLREQAISHTVHRYGNLIQPAPEN